MTTNRRKFLVGTMATAGVAAASKLFPSPAEAQVEAQAAAPALTLSITGLCVLALRPSTRDTTVILVDAGRLPQPLHGHVPMLSIPADCVATSTWAADSVTIGAGGRQYAQWALEGVDLSIAGSTSGDVALDGAIPDLRTMRPDPAGAPPVEHFIDLKHVNAPLAETFAHCRIQVPLAAIRGVAPGRDRWVFRTADAAYTPAQQFGSTAECDVETATPVVITARKGGTTMTIQLQNAEDGSTPRAYVANLPGHYLFGGAHGSEPGAHFAGFYELLTRKGATPLPSRLIGTRDVFPLICYPVIGSK